MSRHTLSEALVKRVVKAAREAGMPVARLEVDLATRRIIVSAEAQGITDDLDRELEKFEERHGQG